MEMSFDFLNDDEKNQEAKSLGNVVSAFNEAHDDVKNKFPSHWEYSMAQKIADKLDIALAEIHEEMKAEIDSSTI